MEQDKQKMKNSGDSCEMRISQDDYHFGKYYYQEVPN